MRSFNPQGLNLKIHLSMSSSKLGFFTSFQHQGTKKGHPLTKNIVILNLKTLKGGSHFNYIHFSQHSHDFRNNGRWLRSSFGGFSCAEILVHQQVDAKDDEIQNENGSDQKQGLF